MLVFAGQKPSATPGPLIPERGDVLPISCFPEELRGLFPSLPQGLPIPPAILARLVLGRLPLAEAVLAIWAHVLTPESLQRIFQDHRGRSFEDVLTFPTFVDLIADALLKYGGSARQSLKHAQEQGTLPTCEGAFYGKLRRVPQELSLGFFEDISAQLRGLLPVGFRATALPKSLDGLTVVIADGKKIKDVGKRLLPVRGAAGKVYGAKLLAAYLPREGLALALAADPDGEANDIRLLPAFLPRARAAIAGPRLWVIDRQFCGLDQPQQFSADGDHYLIRFNRKMSFRPDPARPAVAGQDSRGRRVIEEWGWIGAPTDSRRRWVRRITLVRPGEEDVILITDLVDEATYPAEDLLLVYLARWQIEHVFQEITEVFSLSRLIGSTPEATVFQAGFCLVLYNLIQVVRAYVAASRPQPCAVESLSSELIFRDVQEELIAVMKPFRPEMVAGCVPTGLSRSELVARLQGLLARAWTPRWIKAVNKKPRPGRKKAKGSGAHTSVHKILVASGQRPVKNKPPS
jgi:Transposase DDE domain